jgi:pimeloyl-ACP methyl ester carboxylesterase
MRVRVGDVRLFFDVESAGLAVDGPVMRERPALVLLPGGPGFDHTVFRPSFSPLADLAQVIYLDLRGHGRSDRGDPARWTVEVWADDVRGFCDAVGIEHPVVLGWSFGGMVAMAYAIRHRGHPAKLVLQSAMARLDIDRVAEGFRRIGGEEAATVARTFWSAGGPEAFAAYGRVCAPLYGPSQPDPDGAARALFNLDLLTNPGPVMRGVNLLPGLSSVTCPTLVAVGDLDPMSAVDTADEIVAALPGHLVRFERFAGAGHHIHHDKPGRFFTLLRDFLGVRAATEGTRAEAP